ncbi:hypothetical protein PBY51_015552 [Eleginops maclovinus]|uniref:Uncharacterized protein n=1 Tax=Eleginops maclovinus TaxID=56733 RepID=A0AAN7XPD9_ELEMC|nr:hypothetical protein PBY51_015552 [Eleginops maclovinus]
MCRSRWISCPSDPWRPGRLLPRYVNHVIMLFRSIDRPHRALPGGGQPPWGGGGGVTFAQHEVPSDREATSERASPPPPQPHRAAERWPFRRQPSD